MNKDVVDNPYDAPTDASLIAKEPSDSFPWGIVVLHAVFLVINLLTLYFSVILIDMFEELAVELPVLSHFVYRFARYWYGVGGVLVWFAFFAVFTHYKLRAMSPRYAVIFSSTMILIWIMVTAVLALGVFVPWINLVIVA